MKLQVRDKEFDITFVNNYVREKYQELVELTEDLQAVINDFRDWLKDESLEKKELKEEERRVNKERRELINSVGVLRDDIIREVLETNDYEYDKKWWLHKTTASDTNTFMLDCILKDVEDKNQSKKK